MHRHTCTECGTPGPLCECHDYTPDWVCSLACRVKAEGVCARCHEHPPLPGNSICGNCLDDLVDEAKAASMQEQSEPAFSDELPF